MYLARNKRGIEFTTLIEIILVIIATGLIIGIFNYAASRSDEKTAEILCRGFNALRFGTQKETAVGTFNFAPRACKTIDKNDVPSNDYKANANDLGEGAKAEIRDLMAKCWSMWLEGRQKNMFGVNWYNLQNGCFVCYTFSIDKNLKGEVKYDDFAASLNAPYYAVDGSDKCAPRDQGGKCMPSCDKSLGFSKEATSNKCPTDQKCCISEDSRDECKNKGGQCLDGNSIEFSESYPRWQCKTGSCYLKKDKMASYLDYIQGTKITGGGSGAVIFGEDGGRFSPGSKYAITFISPGKDWNWNTLGGILGTAGLAGLTVAGVYSGVGIVATIVLLKYGIVGTTVASYFTGLTGDVRDINLILVSKYDTVASKCAIEPGVGEK